MGVKFLNQNIVVNSTRPTGFKFPVGLISSNQGGPPSIDYLVVAGGGGGGSYGGGGGGGGFLTGTDFSITQGAQHTIVVGAGGSGSPSTPSGGETPSVATNGSYSLIS